MSDIRSNKYIILKDLDEGQSSKYLLMGMLAFFVIFVIIVLLIKSMSSESFSNNILEQKMYNNMNKNDKDIYINMTEDSKEQVFNNWKN